MSSGIILPLCTHYDIITYLRHMFYNDCYERRNVITLFSHRRDAGTSNSKGLLSPSVGWELIITAPYHSLMHAWQQSSRECHFLSYVRCRTSGGEPRPGRLSRWDSHPHPLPVWLLWRLNQFLRHSRSQSSPKAQTWLSKESGATKHTFWHVNGGEHFLKVWELNTAGVYIYRRLLQNSFLWCSEAGETAEQRLGTFVQPWFWQSQVSAHWSFKNKG